MIDGPVIRTVASRFQPSLVVARGRKRRRPFRPRQGAVLGRGIRIFDQEPPKRPGDPELNMILVHRFGLRREYFRR
jgi:hypothetical protein